MSQGGQLLASGISMAEETRDTGRCPVCDLTLDDHVRCESCTILAGPRHSTLLKQYRRYSICPPCIDAWKAYDAKSGKVTTWEESRHPRVRGAEI